MSKALVTGASGFIGYHLVQALAERGDHVTALVRKTSNVERIEPFGVGLAHGDLTDPESLGRAVAGQDVVYHLAGRVKALRLRGLYDANEGGTENVCRACAEQDAPPALVVVSSLAAAGPKFKDRLRHEGDPPRPRSHYGRSKRAAEAVAERYADRVPITVVRPPIVFGEADPACYHMFRAIWLSNIHFVPGIFPKQFSLIHASDLARLLILAAEQGERLPPKPDPDADPTGEGYYFGSSGEEPSYYELGRMIGAALGRRRVVLMPCPRVAVWVVAGFNDLVARLRGQAAYFSIDKAREATTSYGWACSGEKAARQLGFSVTVPVAERLGQTAKWYRENGWLGDSGGK